jgi:hypothetical protein
MIRLSKGAVAGFKAKPLETFFDGSKGLAVGWYKCTRNPLFAWPEFDSGCMVGSG